MNIETKCENGEVNVKPFGRLDSSTAGEFEEILMSVLDKAETSLKIDMSEVDFISSKGLRVLVSAYRKLAGKEIVLGNVNNSVNEVLRLSGLLKVFKIEND